MNLSRREFSSVMAAALTAGFPLHASAASQASKLYNVAKTGNVHLLHMTDCHAQLLPSCFRKPSVNLGKSSRRTVNGWKNADLPWTYKLEKSKMYFVK